MTMRTYLQRDLEYFQRKLEKYSLLSFVIISSIFVLKPKKSLVASNTLQFFSIYFMFSLSHMEL